ncbi:family 43 glycosylhydrolase [Pseudofrankia sp. BMG5.37]|uniref:family 43 glycosylhydrolase n=1 Tax=Pseudofrankia sp. BMG5.37 TaxID=3050035 RepID=UPI002895DA7E|nr:family 43 glycosylhydrolase [Pseudofrankia sp. BMG5.37]MDT3442912.1 family 43 glycosylhydrolase [Pseudofrankia sp. BMG5.37]
MTTAICNPIDLPYRYQDVRTAGFGRKVFREAADPRIVLFRDRFYLFASMSGGFWHSDDLTAWQFQETAGLPVHDYAPDVREIDGKLVFTASRMRGRCSFWRTDDPLSGHFEEVPGTFAFWDPNLFQDDDGRVYLYWGCSNRAPLRGVELDRRTLTPVSEPVRLFGGDPGRHGWERTGENHDPRTRTGPRAKLIGPAPFIEGAWMTRHQDIYYLQYAAPATEANTYADGYYTSSSPLGPFAYAPDSPFSFKPGGFITGAGHGSTFQDRHGNWWHASTMRVSVNHAFERRIGLFPAGFDEDGTLFTNQELADHPILVHDRPFDPWTEASPGWMLLSNGRPVTATSALPGHGPELAVDENVRTWWVAADRAPGHRLTVDLGDGATVHAVQVNFADHEAGRHKPRPRRGQSTTTMGISRAIEIRPQPNQFVLECSTDRSFWTLLTDRRGEELDSPHAFVVTDRPTQARYLRLTSHAQPWDGPIAVSGLRVFGHRDGPPPCPAIARATRMTDRDARVVWTGADDADGANVRFGPSSKRLYHCWQVHGRTELDLSALTAGEDYWVAVDAFNGSGITRGEPVPVVGPGGQEPR